MEPMKIWSRFIDFVRSRSREEWSSLPQSAWHRFRNWAREHGEQAGVLGLLAGVLIVMLFKLFMFLLVVAGLASFIIWELSVPEAEGPPRGDS